MTSWLRQIFGVTAPAPARPRAKLAVRRRRARSQPDFQRARVYRWEQAHVLPRDAVPLGLAQVYRWAEADRAQEAGWQPPEVKDGRGRRHACGSREVIKLPRWARTRPIVLHECAHGLAPDKHGPRFVATYLDLLERFMNLDRATLLQSLLQAGIRVADSGSEGGRRRA